MKKLLNISVIAALAILPLAANATDITGTQMAYATPTAADATTVATTAYVKGAYKELGTAINSKQDKLSADQLQAIEDVTDLNTDVSALKIAVGDEDSGLVKDVADLQTDKADKSTTYTKTEVDDLLDDKANSADVYDKTTADSTFATKTALDDKADKSTTYTKTEVNGFLDNKANSADVYTKTETYTQTQVDTAITGSANTAAYSNGTNYTTGTVGAAIKSLETASGDYATKTGVVNTVKAATGSVTGVSLDIAGTPAGTISSSLSNTSITASVSVPTNGTVATLTTWGDDASTSTASVTLGGATPAAVSGTVSGDVTSTFSGTGISGTATGNITGIDIEVTGYAQ